MKMIKTAMLGFSMSVALLAAAAAPAKAETSLYGSAYAKNNAAVGAQLNALGVTVDRSNIGSTGVGSSASGLGEAVGNDLKIKTEVGAENNGQVASQTNLVGVALGGGLSGSGALNGAAGPVGGQAQVSVDGKSSAFAKAFGAAADVTSRAAKP